MSDRVIVGDREFVPMISAAQIKERVDAAAQQVNRMMDGKDPICLIALKGGFVFAADLLRKLTFDPEVEFIGLRSYVGMSSSGTVDIIHALDKTRVKGRAVLIIEDIVDTGLTLQTMHNYLLELGASEVVSVVLLLKPDSLQTEVLPDVVGFEIPNKFVVGYGLDYDQRGRALREIYEHVEK